MTPPRNVAPQTPDRLAGWHAGVRLARRGVITPRSVLAAAPTAPAPHAAAPSTSDGGRDLDLPDHSSWLDLERPAG